MSVVRKGGVTERWGLGATGEGGEDWPKVLPVSHYQWRYPSTLLNSDKNPGNTFIGPMCHHSRVPCICMGLFENIQSPICLGQANLRIMNHMWCVSDMQLESSPDVSIGLLPVLEKNNGFPKRDQWYPISRKTNDRSQQTVAATMSKTERFT